MRLTCRLLLARTLRLAATLGPSTRAKQGLEEIAEPAAAFVAEIVFACVSRIAIRLPKIGRRTEFLARLVTARAQLVVSRALFRVAQHFVGLVDRLEFFLGAGFLADVRMEFARKPSVRRLDLGLARTGLDA